MYLASIESKASKILDVEPVVKLPIPIIKIATRLGLTVSPYDLVEGVSGVLVLENGKGTIGYNPRESSVRQRFTVAHELGHYLLHANGNEVFVDHKYKVMFRDEKSSTGEDKREQEANAFAACILMPKDLVEKEISKNEFDLADNDSLKKLAKKFDVSSIAMSIRLANLGLFGSKHF
ncbi:MAG: ImmA/IrrE family metallo-endopeptidase [Flavobacteriales bacterium]|nr:ImmA/IrrE family metallo-endopeptidase [Flavobacteriales bacterium]